MRFSRTGSRLGLFRTSLPGFGGLRCVRCEAGERSPTYCVSTGLQQRRFHRFCSHQVRRVSRRGTQIHSHAAIALRIRVRLRQNRDQPVPDPPAPSTGEGTVRMRSCREIQYADLITACDHRKLACCVAALWECLLDRKSTRLNSSHLVISYAVFCLKKKKTAKKGHLRHSRRLRLRAACKPERTN